MSIGLPKKQTFMERFSRVYEYPYGTSYLSSYVNESGQEVMENLQFERVLQREREMKPFHLECSVTKKKICFCTQGTVKEEQRHGFKPSMRTPGYRRLALDTQLYYEGQPDGVLERARDKLSFERERLMQLANPNHIDTFEKYVEFGEEEIDPRPLKAKQPVARQHQPQPLFDASKNQHCASCSVLIDPPIPRVKGLMDLCNECQYVYVSITVGEQPKGADKKRVNKLLEKMGEHDLDPKLGKKKAPAKQTAPACGKCEKEARTDDFKVLICCKCKRRYHDSCHEPPLNASLVKKHSGKPPLGP